MKYHHKSYKVLMVLGPLIISSTILVVSILFPFIKEYFEERISDLLYIVFSLFALTALLYTFLLKPLEDKIKERYSYLEDNNPSETIKDRIKQNIFILRTWQKIINLYFIVSICILGISLSMIIFEYPILVRAFLLNYIIVLQIMFLSDLATIITRNSQFDFRGLEKKYFQSSMKESINNKVKENKTMKKLKECIKKTCTCRKPLYKKGWIWFLGFILLLGALHHSFKYAVQSESSGDLATMIAGWISGIATAILGGIALWQNKRYKEENEKTLMQTKISESAPLATMKNIELLPLNFSKRILIKDNQQEQQLIDNNLAIDNSKSYHLLKFCINLKRLNEKIANKVYVNQARIFVGVNDNLIDTYFCKNIDNGSTAICHYSDNGMAFDLTVLTDFDKHDNWVRADKYDLTVEIDFILLGINNVASKCLIRGSFDMRSNENQIITTIIDKKANPSLFIDEMYICTNKAILDLKLDRQKFLGETPR